MSKFTERLWRDLEREHGPELAQIDRPAGADRTRFARPRLLAGTTVALAVAGAAIVLVLSAASTPAAFAVTGNSDGTYSVVLKRLAGIKGANERLAALGVRAKLVQVTPGCRADLPPAAVADLKTPGQVLIHAGRVTRIDPRKIPRGRVLMIVSWAAASKVHVARLNASVATVPNCIAGPPPRALRIAWAVAHGCHIAAAAMPSGAVVLGRGRWTMTHERGTVTGNSGPFTGSSGGTVQIGAPGKHIRMPAPPKEIRMAKGCPKPEAAPKPPPAAGTSSSAGDSGPTGNSGNSGSVTTTTTATP